MIVDSCHHRVIVDSAHDLDGSQFTPILDAIQGQEEWGGQVMNGCTKPQSPRVERSINAIIPSANALRLNRYLMVHSLTTFGDLASLALHSSPNIVCIT